MTLPRVEPLSGMAVLRFELTEVLPEALALLRRHLSRRALARVLARLALGALRDPLRQVPRVHADTGREALARRQFRSVVRIDDALRAERSLSDQRRQDLLRALMASSGRAFIARGFVLPTPASWRAATSLERTRFLERATGWFINADIEGVRADEHTLGFDVSRCLFAELARAVGRPELGPLFCIADEEYFGSPTSLVSLTRTRTLARDAQPCDFRFRYK